MNLILIPAVLLSVLGTAHAGGFVSKPDETDPLHLRFKKAVQLYEIHNLIRVSDMGRYLQPLTEADYAFLANWEKNYLTNECEVIPDPEVPISVHRVCYNLVYMKKFIDIMEGVYGVQIEI